MTKKLKKDNSLKNVAKDSSNTRASQSLRKRQTKMCSTNKQLGFKEKFKKEISGKGFTVKNEFK